MTLLSQPPTNARNFLVTDVYGLGIEDAKGQSWLQAIFDGLIAFHAQDPPLNVAFANFATIWDGVLGPDPGYRAFGYVSTDACNPGPTTDGDCSDPDHYFYWFTRCVQVQSIRSCREAYRKRQTSFEGDAHDHGRLRLGSVRPLSGAVTCEHNFELSSCDLLFLFRILSSVFWGGDSERLLCSAYIIYTCAFCKI